MSLKCIGEIVIDIHSGHKSSLLDADIKSAKAVFDVNVFGLLEVTQAFAPLLVASKGRVVNIGSIAGIVPIPFEGIYNASKSAVELLSAQMRVEFMPFGVDVIHVHGTQALLKHLR